MAAVDVSDSTLLATVFTFNSSETYPCIRIPSIISVPVRESDDYQLIAFAECRKFLGDGCVFDRSDGDQGNQADPFGQDRFLCMKTSSDGGKTWSDLRTNLTSMKIADPSAVFVPPSTVIVQFDDVSTYPNIGAVMQIKSTDYGETWGFQTNVSQQIGSLVRPGTGNAGIYAPSLGSAGRIIFTGYQPGPPGSQGRVWYSDNGGDTYKMAAPPLYDFGESQIVFQPNGSVRVIARNTNSLDCHCRWTAVSNDGGANFYNTNQTVPSLIEPSGGCQGPVVAYPRGKAILVSGPGSTTERVAPTIWASKDNGETWIVLTTLASPSTAAAYSAMTVVADTLYVMWETSATGCQGASCRIVISAVDLATLL